MQEKIGWAVEIKSYDGTKSIARMGSLVSPAIWSLDDRDKAKTHKTKCSGVGLEARIVKVRYTEPEIID